MEKEQLNEKEKLIEQFYENQEGLISSQKYLISEFGLDIVSALYGLEIKATEDVTEKVISGLAQKGKILVDNDLVGGDDNDPVKHVRKELYVDYIQGRPFAKSVPERSTLSIKDLIKDFNDNKPRISPVILV